MFFGESDDEQQLVSTVLTTKKVVPLKTCSNSILFDSVPDLVFLCLSLTLRPALNF